MRRLIAVLVVLGICGLALFLLITRPAADGAEVLAGLAPDPVRGEAVFWAAGCAGCHSAAGAEGEARLVLSGGRALVSPFGTFHAPNISPDPVAGIGGWTALDLWNAMRHGTSPRGAHYFPAFPYASYTRASPEDVVSLHAFLQGLPPSDIASKPHDVGFPFSQRWLLGGWKFLFFGDGAQVQLPADPQLQRGQYLVEALGHCGECHTPRNALGGLQGGRWLAGGPNPAGEGRIPNITPGGLSWSAGEIAEFLKSGFTPDFDTAGGEMTEVVKNLAALTDADRAAIAAYLKALPALQ